MIYNNLEVKMTALNQASAKINAVSGSVNKLDDSAKKANKSAKNFGKSWESFGSRVNVLGQRMSGAITLPLVMLGKQSIDTAVSVERAWTRFNKVFSGTKEDAKALREAGTKFSTKFGVDVENVAEIMGEFNKAGIESKNKLIELTDQALQTSILFDTDLKSAFNGVKSIMFGFGLGVDDTKDALASINIIADKTTTSEQDILDVLQKSGGVFKQNGISIREAAAMTSLLAQSNIKGTIAGNMFKTVIAKVNDATPKATKEMKAFGINVSGNAFRTSSFVDKLKMLHNKQSKVFSSGNEVKIKNFNTAVKDLTGLRQLNRFSILISKVDQLGGVMEISADKTKNLEYWNKQLREVMKSEPHNLDVMNELYRNQQAILGNKLLPLKMELLKLMTKMIEKFNSLSPETQDFIIKLGIIVAATGPVLVYFGVLITTLGFLTSSFSFMGLSISLVFTSIGIALAILVVAWAKNWGNIQGKTKETWKNIKRWYETDGKRIWEEIKKDIGILKTWFKNNWDDISNIFSDAWKIMKGFFDIGWAVLSGAIKIAVDIFKGDWGKVWGDIGTIFHNIWEGSDGKGGFVKVVSASINLIKNLVKLGTQALIDAFSKMSVTAQSIFLGLGIYFTAWYVARKLETLYLIGLYTVTWIKGLALWAKGTIAKFAEVAVSATTLKGILSLLAVPIVIVIGIGSIIAAIKAAHDLGKAMNEATQSNDVNLKSIDKLMEHAKTLKETDHKRYIEEMKLAQKLANEEAKNQRNLSNSLSFFKLLGHASGGIIHATSGYFSQGEDTVPAMLSPGEMVLNKGQQSSLFNLLSGKSQLATAGGPTVNINVGTMVASRGEQREFARKIEGLLNEDKGRY